MISGRLYLSGGMSGIPEFNFPAFNALAKELRGKGYEVINPAEHGAKDSWEQYLAYDLKLLLQCDAIVMLPEWEQSKGAKLEYFFAVEHGKTVLDHTMEPLQISSPDISDAPPTSSSSSTPLSVVWSPSSETVLQEADRLVSGDRNHQYGEPWEDYERVASLWSILDGIKHDRKKCILKMIALKLARLCVQYKRDTMVDICGYVRCLEKVLDYETMHEMS